MSKQSEKRAESPESDDTPINLGFGIPAPPPSYKAAISVKNTDKYKVSVKEQLMK